VENVMHNNKKHFLRFIFCVLLLSTPQKTHCLLWLLGIPYTFCVAYMATENGRNNIRSTLMYVIGFLFYAKKDMQEQKSRAETQELQKEKHEQAIQHTQELSKKNLEIALTTKDLETLSQIAQKAMSENEKLKKKLNQKEIQNKLLENALQKNKAIMVEAGTQMPFLVEDVQALETSPENENLVNQINHLLTDNTQQVSLNLQNNTNFNTVVMNNKPTDTFQEKKQSEYGPVWQAVLASQKIHQTRNSFLFQSDPLSDILSQKARTQHVQPNNDEFKIYAQKHAYHVDTLRTIFNDHIVFKRIRLERIVRNATNIQRNIQKGQDVVEAILLHKTEQDLCSLTGQPEEQSYSCSDTPAHQNTPPSRIHTPIDKLLEQNKKIITNLLYPSSPTRNSTKNNSTLKHSASHRTAGKAQSPIRKGLMGLFGRCYRYTQSPTKDRKNLFVRPPRPQRPQKAITAEK
jgi:hypothetical protein